MTSRRDSSSGMGVSERENDSMTSTIKRTAYKEMEEEYHALIDALPQFIWILRPDGSLAYGNQRWRDYINLMSQHSGEQVWFQHQLLNDCPRFQDRQHTPPQTSSLSEKDVWDKEVWLQN